MLESELVEKIEAYLLKYQIRYTKEVRMGIGVPDIALNIGASKAILPISDYYFLLAAEYLNINKKITGLQLSDYLSYSKAKTQNYLNKLVMQKVAINNGAMYLINKKIFGLNLGNTISIEAKIRDWRSGILQAERYLMFSDYSYLALPEDKIRNVDLELIEQKGIGLLSITEDSIVEVVKPRISTECDYKLKYIITSAIICENRNSFKRRPDKIFSKL